jgi:hypothetical protein
MAVERKAPKVGDRIVTEQGEAERRFYRFLVDLPDVMSDIADLDPAATLTDVINKINAILAELKAAKIMEE